MREIRPFGSEGGMRFVPHPYPYVVENSRIRLKLRQERDRLCLSGVVEGKRGRTKRQEVISGLGDVASWKKR